MIQTVSDVFNRAREIELNSLKNPDEEMKALENAIISKVNTMLTKSVPEGIEQVDYVKMSTLSSNLVRSTAAKVKVDVSLGRGRGLFAKRDIKSGELITCYPGDIVLHHVGISEGKRKWRTFISDRYEGFLGGKNLPNIDFDHMFELNKDYAIIGIRDLDQDSSYLGHFVNDFCKVTVDEQTDLKTITEKSKAAIAGVQRSMLYQKLSMENMNCVIGAVLGGMHVVVVAIKDIKAGDEVFASYGIAYWNAYNNQHRPPSAAAEGH